MSCHRSGLLFKLSATVILLMSMPISVAQTSGHTRNLKDTTEPVVQAAPTGRFYALIIGISAYQHLPRLQTPLNDAKELATVLSDQYGFQTQLLLDASRDQILEAMDKYRRTLNAADNLVIYYAGHGYFDKEMDQAYWAPVDAGQDTYARWIIATEVTGTAKAIPARHVLVISDSCYSGMLTRDARLSGLSGDRANYLQKMIQTKSRNVLSSGGNEPVADSDAPGHFSSHSVFANVLLQDLSKPQVDEFTAGQLFTQLREQVGGRSKQVPEYSPIRDSLHEGGDFVFLRLRKGKSDEGKAIIHAEVDDPVITRTNPDQEAVNAALNSYEEAYESMDVRELRKVWPSLSKNQEKQIKGGFQAPGLNAVKVQLRNRTMNVSGQTAKADCDQWMVYTFSGARQPPQTSSVEILLAKDDRGGWVVNSVKGR